MSQHATIRKASFLEDRLGGITLCSSCALCHINVYFTQWRTYSIPDTLNTMFTEAYMSKRESFSEGQATWHFTQSFSSQNLTHVTPTVPEVLGVVVAGIYPHTVGVYLRQKLFVVVDKLFRVGHGQLQGMRFTEWVHFPVLLW